MTVAIQKCRQGDADAAVSLKRLPADGPGRPQLHGKPIVVRPYVGIRRNSDLDLGPGAVADPIVGIDQTRLLQKPYPFLWGIPVELGPNPQIVLLGLENHRSLDWITPALPKAHRALASSAGWRSGGCGG